MNNSITLQFVIKWLVMFIKIEKQQKVTRESLISTATFFGYEIPSGQLHTSEEEFFISQILAMFNFEMGKPFTRQQFGVILLITIKALTDNDINRFNVS